MRQRTEQNIKSPSDHEAIWSVPRKQKWFTLNGGRDRSWTSKRRESLCSYCIVWPPLWRTEWYSHYKERPSQPQICAQRDTRHFSPEFWLFSTKKHSHVVYNLKACYTSKLYFERQVDCNITLDWMLHRFRQDWISGVVVEGKQQTSGYLKAFKSTWSTYMYIVYCSFFLHCVYTVCFYCMLYLQLINSY